MVDHMIDENQTDNRLLRRLPTMVGVAALLSFTLPGAARADDEATAFINALRAGKLDAPLDFLVTIPEVWNLTPDQLDARFPVPSSLDLERNPYFEWMCEERDRAVFIRQPHDRLTIDLTIFDKSIPVEEVVVDFLDGRINGIRMVLYSRGDSGQIDPEEFDRRLKQCGQKIGERLGVRPTMRRANLTQGLLSEGWVWISENGMSVLDYNPEAVADQKFEYLRLRLAPRNAQGIHAAAFQSRPAAVRVSQLPSNVTTNDDGDVFIPGIPMVDQGPKGYCVVASVQRLFEY
jgi:hypothetical protein